MDKIKEAIIEMIEEMDLKEVDIENEVDEIILRLELNKIKTMPCSPTTSCYIKLQKHE